MMPIKIWPMFKAIREAAPFVKAIRISLNLILLYLGDLIIYIYPFTCQ